MGVRPIVWAERCGRGGGKHVVGCGDMWQGVGTCGMGGGRVWGHVAGVWICQLHERSWSDLAMCKLLCANWSCKLVGVKACDRVWGHVAWVVAGCGGMWQGSGYVMGGQA